MGSTIAPPPAVRRFSFQRMVLACAFLVGTAAAAQQAPGSPEELMNLLLSDSGSTYLPFLDDESLIEELKTRFSEDPLPVPACRIRLGGAPDVPSRVTYIRIPDEENQKAAATLVDALTTPEGLAKMQGDRSLICGPHLYALLARAGIARSWRRPLAAFSSQIDGDQHVLMAQSIAGASTPAFLGLMRNLICGSGPVTVRRLDAPELDWYWTFISWDITEPIFIVECGSHDLMVDFGETGRIFFVDLFDNLEWGDRWTSLMQRAASLSEEGEADRSVIAAEKALTLAERKWGMEHPRTVGSLMAVGVLSATRGDWARAEDSLLLALGILEKHVAADDPRIADCLEYLALVYDGTGRHDDMRAAEQRAAAIRAHGK